MEYEIELKLLTDNRAGEIIEKRLLPSLKSKIKKEVVVLTNHYFDTPNRLLRKHDIGLRIRSNDRYCEQTLKTSGQSIGGLHKRPEFNVSLDNFNRQSTELPDLSLFEVGAWPETFDVEYAQRNLEVMFSTNFVRHIYLLESGNTVIEMVWDLGEVCAANESLPICEIELELKEGEIGELFNLAKQIASMMPLGIGVHSKAARGYRLADKTKVQTNVLSTLSDNSLVDVDECLLSINAALSHFQLCSTFFAFNQENKSINEVANITKALNMLSVSVGALLKLTSCKELSQLVEKSVKLNSLWSSIIDNIKVEKTGDLELCEQLSVFLTSSETIVFQLELVQVMLEKPWDNL